MGAVRTDACTALGFKSLNVRSVSDRCRIGVRWVSDSCQLWGVRASAHVARVPPDLTISSTMRSFPFLGQIGVR